MESVKKDAVAIMDTEVQPLWFKILKTLTLIIAIVLILVLGGLDWFLIIIGSLLFNGTIVHLLYRYNTGVYTREWMGWKPPGAEGSRIIGWQYYTMIFSGWIIFGVLAYLVFA